MYCFFKNISLHIQKPVTENFLEIRAWKNPLKNIPLVPKWYKGSEIRKHCENSISKTDYLSSIFIVTSSNLERIYLFMLEYNTHTPTYSHVYSFKGYTYTYIYIHHNEIHENCDTAYTNGNKWKIQLLYVMMQLFYNTHSPIPMEYD